MNEFKFCLCDVILGLKLHLVWQWKSLFHQTFCMRHMFNRFELKLGNLKKMVSPSNFSMRDDGRSMDNLVGEPSEFSLTFGVSHDATGASGRDPGFMNIEELIKNVGTDEELEALASAMQTCQGGATCGNLQQQCSFLLSRMLSQKIVEVLKDGGEESSGKDVNTNAGPKLKQRQQTCGEMTLDEFLVTAGVVEGDTQLAGRQSNYSELSSLNNDAALSLGFPVHSNGNARVFMEDHNISNHNGSLSQPLLTNLTSCGLQEEPASDQTMASYGCLQRGEYTGYPIMSEIIGIGNPTINHFSDKAQQLEQVTELITSGVGAVTLPTRSSLDQLCVDGMSKGDGYTPSFTYGSSFSYDGFNGKEHYPTVENICERRKKRMLKNKQSAARSRARKQAYTTELEVELAGLKEENEALKKKQRKVLCMATGFWIKSIKTLSLTAQTGFFRFWKQLSTIMDLKNNA